MLYWSLMFLFALTAGLLAIAFTAAGARKILPAPYPHIRWDSATYIPPWLRRLRVRALAAARRIRRTRLGRLNWRRDVRYFAICTTVITVALVTVGIHHVYFDRTDLPDIEPFTRFEFPTIGTSTMPTASHSLNWQESTGRSPSMRTSRRLFAMRSSPRRTRISSHMAELTIR